MLSTYHVICSQCHLFTSMVHAIHLCHPVTMSFICHVIQSPCLSFTRQSNHHVIQSPCHPVTMPSIYHAINSHSPCHPFTMSSSQDDCPCHPFTMSYIHHLSQSPCHSGYLPLLLAPSDPPSFHCLKPLSLQLEQL